MNIDKQCKPKGHTVDTLTSVLIYVIKWNHTITVCIQTTTANMISYKLEIVMLVCVNGKLAPDDNNLINKQYTIYTKILETTSVFILYNAKPQIFMLVQK